MEYLAGGKSSHEEDLTKLREDFIEKYCNQNGWDKESLTIEQMNIIRSHKEYNTPYLIRG